jgi:signal transduction histidine kinase
MLPMTPDVSDTNPSASRRRVGLLTSVGLVVALLATAATGTLAYREQGTAARERGQASAGLRLTTRLAEVDAAEWRAIADPDTSSVRALADATDQLEAARGFIHFDREAVTESFDAAFPAYVDTIHQETDLLADSRMAEAHEVDETEVDPAYETLRGAVDGAVAWQEQIADDAAAAANRITFFAAALGALTLAFLIVQILAQRRLIARERKHLQALEGLDRLKDEFVASVSHELRTPLTSIRGYLELVLEGEVGELTEEQREFLLVVDRNAERLMHLVGDLLDVAQIEAGRIALDLVDEKLTGLVAQSVEAARPVAGDRGIELAMHPNGEAHVRVDRTRVAQVLDNLLSNALKFTETGGRVDVRLSTSNGSAFVEVADTGMGISAEDQAKLFQRFYRTATAGEKAIVGTGLGLWISKAIVEAHGGEITVESAVDRGTTFRVEIPTAREGR